jgi:glycerol-1-phosphatase
MDLRQDKRRDHLSSSLSADDALDAYEEARHRLPNPILRNVVPQVAKNLDELADEFDAFFLDAFGVLNVGEAAIQGVPERVAALQSAGKRVIVVSNAAGFPHKHLIEKYASLGYTFEPEDIVTSRRAMALSVGDGAGLKWGLVVSDGISAAEFERLDHIRLREDPADYEIVERVLMIGSATWTEARQAMLEASLSNVPRPVYVGNPDIVAPREKGFSIEPGYFAHRLADRTGIVPEFFGKPFRNIYEIAFAQLKPEISRDRVLMVGDSLHTDILGSHVAGIRSALVTDHGFLAGRDVKADIERTRLVPDFILPSP